MDQRGEIAVLHVDDEPALADTVATFLESEDDRFNIDTAMSASEGLEMLVGNDYDCIVSDYDMPGGNGIEFLEAVRDEYPDIPFVLYTGKGSEEIASKAISAGVTDYLQKKSGTAQYTVLANRVANAVAKYRSTERAEVIHRVRRILRDVNQRLVRARSRDEIESEVCRVIGRTEPYQLAWIGVQRGTDRSIEPKAMSGEATDYLDAITIPSVEMGTLEEPAELALREEELTTVQSISADAPDGSWREAAADCGFGSVAAVPMTHGEKVYGVLAVYSDRASFFDERERELLVELGEDTAHAIQRVESEQELREQRAELRVYKHAVESSTDLLAGIDTEYTLIFANERYRRFHGFSQEDVGELSLPDVLGEEWDEEVKQRENRVLEGDVVRYEIERTDPDGERRTFSVQDFPLKDESGAILGVVGSMRDITERKEKERQLRQLKERLDLAVDAANIGVWDWNVQTDEVRFNEQWAEMLGYSLSEIEPHLGAWEKRVHPDDMASAQEALDAHLAGETEYYECEHRMRTADGSWKWIRDIGKVTKRNEAGEPIRAVGIHLDIDDRKQRERALRESEQRYRSLFESNPAVVWVQDFSAVIDAYESLREEVTDVEAHLNDNPEVVHRLLEYVEIINVSDQALERYGAPSKEALMTNLDDIFAPEAYDANVEIWRRLADGETNFRVPTVVETFDGDRLEEIIGVKVPDAYADDYSLVYLTGMDITERKRRERKLTALHDVTTDLERGESVEYICERTIEASQDILEFDLSIIDIEEDGYLSTVALSEDVPAQETTRMSIDEGIAGKTFRTGESLLIDEMEDNGEAKPQGPFRSGISVPMGDHGVFQAVAEEPDYFNESDLELAELLLSHTESALDRLEHERRLRRQNERLEEFASIVSHDLRNPLHVARSHLELARREQDFGHIKTAIDAHKRMETLIENLLTLARDGEREMTVESIDIGEFARQCWQTVETTDATLVVEADHTIRADRSQLQHLVENLVHNAVEHGGPDVTVRIGPLDDGFYVADDGPGITPDERSAVFESGYSTAEDGTGFGLGIVERVVDAHGWEITVADSRDGGARFEITGVTVFA
ncbi:MAG: PAS domain S-box protein [Halapricum sp.]